MAVEDRRGQAGFAPGLLAAGHDQDVVDPLQGTVIVPQIEIAMHGRARGHILQQRPPLAARAEHLQQPVHHRAQIDRTLAAAAFGRRDQPLYQPPLGVGQITGIAQANAIVASPVLLRPHRKPPPQNLQTSTNRSKISKCLRTDP